MLLEDRARVGERPHDRDGCPAAPRHWDQLKLPHVRYADYTDDGVTKSLVSATFEYEDRPDPLLGAPPRAPGPYAEAVHAHRDRDARLTWTA
jgi:hypothetical protein